MSPALPGGFLTTSSPGRPHLTIFLNEEYLCDFVSASLASPTIFSSLFSLYLQNANIKISQFDNMSGKIPFGHGA